MIDVIWCDMMWCDMMWYDVMWCDMRYIWYPIYQYIPVVMGQVILQAIAELYTALHWRHNGRHSISNHQPHDCLLNRLFRLRSKKTSKLCVTGFVRGIHHSPGPGEFPAQWPVMQKMFPFDDVIMVLRFHLLSSTGIQSLTHCGLVIPYGFRRSWLTWEQVMACCLMAPNHYPNYC